MTRHSDFPKLVEAFFTERLLRQRKASPETIAGYRDAFRLLLRFAARRLKKEPSKLALKELDARFIGEFLDHLEAERSNSIRTRNARLAAIHSFFRYVSFEEPSCADQCRRILAIPSKRYERRPIAYLTREEIDALVAAPDTTTWIGRRDQVLLLVAIQTGLRVSELIGLQRQDVRLGRGAHVQLQGEGKKATMYASSQGGCETPRPLAPQSVPKIPVAPVFPSSRGGSLSRDAVERLVTRHRHTAARRCPSLKTENGDAPRASPHRSHGTPTTWHRPLRSSHCGWDMSPSRRLKCTSMRTCVSRNRPCPEFRRWASSPGDTARMTSCWPSWRASDYAASHDEQPTGFADFLVRRGAESA